MNIKKLVSTNMHDVMTPERLRAHWFGPGRVPFWNYDPAQLTMGLEIEYFIGRTFGNDFKLATKSQYLEVIANLVMDFGYSDRDLRDQPGRVSKDTARGFIAIKPDFAWHILEIALPPRNSTDEIRELLTSTFLEVDAALKKAGLERLDMSCLPDVPEQMDLVELDRLSSHIDLLRIVSDGSNYAVPVFPALIVATHIHANIFDENCLENLPKLYKFEQKAISQFSRVQRFQDKVNVDHRSRFYESSLGRSYKLRTIPNPVPKSVEDFCQLFNSSPKLFPNDSFFSSRDMTYIRPTRHGTLEFRSSCSFLEIEKLIDLVIFRRSQILDTLNSRFIEKVALR